MTQATPHRDETKAAVIAALLAGQSVSAISREYHISRDTIRAWRQSTGLSSTPAVSQEKRADFGNLIADYLAKVLATVSIQAEQFADRPWLARQEASQVAVLHGVLVDKAIRLLEALGDPDEGNDAA